MAERTEHYGLPVGVVADDIIEAEHHNRLAATLDRVVGNVLCKLWADGAYQGWELTEEKTVSAGEGLVGGCWCRTAGAQSISGLTPHALNYVFARKNNDSAPMGAVDFAAQLYPDKPVGAVYLGWMILDENGNVLEIDNQASGVDRNCLRLEIGEAKGSGLVLAVPPGEDFVVEITHSLRLIVPGALEFSCENEDFSWELIETYRPDGFKVRGKNNGTQEADFVYAWRRRGFVE